MHSHWGFNIRIWGETNIHIISLPFGPSCFPLARTSLITQDNPPPIKVLNLITLVKSLWLC